MWKDYFNVASLEEALDILAEKREHARIVAGATDLILELERKIRVGIDTLVDITRVPALDQIVLDEDGVLHLGPLVTHNHCVASKLVVERAFPLAQAAWQVGAPQVRNRGTIAGNLITASPANDTITPLMALGASVTLRSHSGMRVVPLSEFYTGVRKTVMQPDEMLVDISFSALRTNQRGTFIKLGLRQAQAISLVNAAVILTFADDGLHSLTCQPVDEAAITLGAVAPTIIHAAQAEASLRGNVLDEAGIARASELAQANATPIDDVRGPADYRSEMVRICVRRALSALRKGEERNLFPAAPVFLRGKDNPGKMLPLQHKLQHSGAQPVVTNVNGKEYTLSNGYTKTLLRLLREDVGLTGTKEGCAEGECGACTVYLDGVAVMSCLVPAPRAHAADVVTIEGLAIGEELHPVQQAFIDEGAVQCGYCTPGFIMSAAKLLEERPQPTHSEIQQAITGNLCRCTGYYAIANAIELAARRQVTHD